MKKKQMVRGKEKVNKTGKEKSKQTLADENNGDDTNHFQLGGLPNRDLKKNLGCG